MQRGLAILVSAYLLVVAGCGGDASKGVNKDLDKPRTPTKAEPKTEVVPLEKK